MNDPGDLAVTHTSGTPDPKNCSLVSIIPIVGMSSCRGRAEAFARRLSSKLRTLGTQADEEDVGQEDEPVINGGNTNTWVTGAEQTVTDLQPLRNETDTFFDFDCELESPGSPVDECEYLRLIESTTNTPHNSAAESGYACSSAASLHCSSDGPYFELNSVNEVCRSNFNQPSALHQPTNERLVTAQQETANDEVDSSTCLKTTTLLATDQCMNDYENHKDLIQKLPSEAPDIDIDVEQNLNENYYLEKQISMSQSVQQQILRELRRQSLEYNNVEEDNNVRNLEDQQMLAEQTTILEVEAPNTQQIVNIINGHAENGEDVLQIEVIEVPKVTAVNDMKLDVELETKVETKVEVENDTKDVISSANENMTVITKDANENEISKIEKKSHTNMDTTADEDNRPERVRRCSSLKTGKTPPGTPGCKKIVRFADVLGLDLADIKTFLDEIPKIPKSAYEDLEIAEAEPPVQMGPKSDKLLMPLFQQPAGLPNFLDVVREKLVSLENAAVTDVINQTITGSVRVRNLDFHKSVHIRYTLDNWRSFADLQANYVANSCDGFSDTFSFTLFGNSLHIGQRLQFAVRFQCKGQQYWDNNYGANYCFQCLPSVASNIHTNTPNLPSHHSNSMATFLSPTIGESWCTSFY